MQVLEFVKLKELCYAGSHGMDIMTSSAHYEHNAEKVSISCSFVSEIIKFTVFSRSHKYVMRAILTVP